jgi:MFS family permease
MDGVGGLAGWRWIFILAGLLTVVVAFAAPFAIHDSPETATFLTEQERAFVIHALRIQNSADAREMVQDESKFHMKYVIDAFKDWQIWLGLLSELHSGERRVNSLATVLLTRLIKCTGVSPARSMVSPSSSHRSSRIWGTSLPPHSS